MAFAPFRGPWSDLPKNLQGHSFPIPIPLTSFIQIQNQCIQYRREAYIGWPTKITINRFSLLTIYFNAVLSFLNALSEQ